MCDAIECNKQADTVVWILFHGVAIPFSSLFYPIHSPCVCCVCVCLQGVECLCNSGECMFLVLPSPQARNRLHQAILDQTLVRLNKDSLEQATLNWVRGDMTNYQYLMLLNLWVNCTVSPLACCSRVVINHCAIDTRTLVTHTHARVHTHNTHTHTHTHTCSVQSLR